MPRFSFLFLMAGLAVTSASADEMSANKSAKTIFTVRIENVSTTDTLRSATGATAPAPHSPGLWVVHTRKRVVFAEGKLDRGVGLEAQAEDGDPSRLAASIEKIKGALASGVFNTPVGDDKPGPALPGKAYEFSFAASPGHRLTVTTMFGHQAPRQAAPNTGPSERSPVRRIQDVHDGFAYPRVEQVIRVTITPRSSAVTAN